MNDRTYGMCLGALGLGAVLAVLWAALTFAAVPPLTLATSDVPGASPGRRAAAPGTRNTRDYATTGLLDYRTTVTPTNTWVDFYSLSSTTQGQPLPVGAEIGVFDPQGVQCGRFTVTHTGMYGVMPCYGDDPLTSQDEGAVLGDVLRFTINGQAAQTEAISVNGAPVPPNTVVIWSPAQSLWQVNLRTAAEGTYTPTPTATATPTSSVTPTATTTGTPAASATPTPTPSPSASPTETGMAPPSHTPTSSATVTVTPTRTPTLTVTATVTRTATQTSRQLWLPLVLRRS